MSLHELNTQLLGYEADLSKIGLRYPVLAREAAQARLIYDLAYDDAMDTIAHEYRARDEKITIPAQEAQARQRCALQMKEARMAEAELNGAKTYISTLEAILSSAQTRGKLYMIEYSLNGRQT